MTLTFPKATDVEGIFRLNGSAKRIKDLQEIFDSPERYGKGLDWSGYTVHDAANVLRRYLNQLPEPIVPLEFYERFREPLRIYQQQVQGDTQASEAETFDHAKAVATYQQLIVDLPPLNKQLLLYILDLLAVFASKSEQNRMTSANLSAIFQPGMLSHPQHDMAPAEYKLSQDVLIFLIENQDHFLVGMSGTVADEQQIKEVEAGLASSRPATQPTSSNLRRSVSSASASSQSHRKLDTLRRNVSVSSRNSRHSNTAPSPGTPTSGGGSVHRSNTLPSKMGTVVTSARLARSSEAGNNHHSALTAPHNDSRSTSQTPSFREAIEQRNSTAQPPITGTAYVHTATHGPIPLGAAKRLSISETPRPQENLSVPASPPKVVTPTRERKLSNLFARSPPPEGDPKEPRQPNRLKKKRIPGSASMSAQSSTNSLPGASSEQNLIAPLDQQPLDGTVGDTTPRPAATSTMDNRDAPTESTPTVAESSSRPNTENSLRPHASRTPSMNSRSSFTDQSDYDQPEETFRSERRDHRRSWRFHRSSKRSSEQIGLGLASPPLVATSSAAEHSSSSVGSGQQPASDISNQPLSLDAGVQGGVFSNAEPEKRSFFGKFKAKMAQVREGAKDDRERSVRSPSQSDLEPTASSQIPSPPAVDQTNGKPSIELPTEPPKEEPLRSPVSPLPGTGMPPSIPEEPHSPVVSSAGPDAEAKQPVPGNESVEAIPPSESGAVSEQVKEPSEKVA